MSLKRFPLLIILTLSPFHVTLFSSTLEDNFDCDVIGRIEDLDKGCLQIVVVVISSRCLLEFTRAFAASSSVAPVFCFSEIPAAFT